MYCFVYFQASEEEENNIKVINIKEAGPVQFTPLDPEQRQATCELVKLKNQKPGQELKYVNVGRVCNNIHPNHPKHTQRIQGDGNCLFRALCCAITGMQMGHRALCQIICDYLCQGTFYTGMDGAGIAHQFANGTGQGIQDRHRTNGSSPSLRHHVCCAQVTCVGWVYIFGGRVKNIMFYQNVKKKYIFV